MPVFTLHYVTPFFAVVDHCNQDPPVAYYPLKDVATYLSRPTLKYRRLRGDMIEVFKITYNIYDLELSPELKYYSKSNTRCNKYKLLNHMFHYDTRKYSFTACIVNIWNSRPNFVADVDTVCLFKARLDIIPPLKLRPYGGIEMNVLLLL